MLDFKLLKTETSKVIFAETPAAIEGQMSQYSCSAIGGVPEPKSFMWFIDDVVVPGCENVLVGSECNILINGSYHNKNLKCQEFHKNYPIGEYALHRLDVWCR